MQGVSLTHAVLAFFFFFFYLGSFSYSSHAGFYFLSAELLLHISCWLHFCLESFSYTSGDGLIFIGGVSLTHPVLASFLSGEFLLHISRWLHFYTGSFSYTLSSSSFFFFFFKYKSGEFLLHISCWFLFSSLFYQGSFSYTSRAGFFFYRRSAGFIFVWGLSLTQPVLASSFCGEFLLHIPSRFLKKNKKSVEFLLHIPFWPLWGASLVCSLLWRQPLKKSAGWKMAQKKKWKITLKPEKEPYNTLYRAEQNQTRVSLTHPLLASLCGAFLLHILCWLPYVWSFSYTSCAGFFVWDLLTHPVLASLCEIFLHILCWLLCVRSYTSCAGFFVYGVSLTCTVLASSCGEFLLHIPCWPLYAGHFSYISMLDSLCL